MQAARPPILRGALLLAALAAIAFIMARGDNPAAATTYNPHNNVSVSDSTPGAAADIIIDFSLEIPDSFPNVRTDSSIQFLPRSWGVHVPETDEEKLARVGGIAGTFNALSTLGIFGISPCTFQVPVPFTMVEATTDTSNLASALDVGGDAHPGGPGYSGQFINDPATAQPPGDLGLPLISFNADEKYSFAGVGDYSSWIWMASYRDVDGDNNISAGDIRLEDYGTAYYQAVFGMPYYPGGTVVQEGDWDIHNEDDVARGETLLPFRANQKHVDPDGNGQMDAGEGVYKDADGSNTVSYGDVRQFELGDLEWGTTVEDFALPGGVSRYPDFLNQMFPLEVVGQPLARQWGGQMVILSAVSLNILTFRPGQLPGYPAQLGYPNVVVLLNPVAPVDTSIINLTSDLCTSLSLTATNLGVSQDNPATFKNDGGYVRLTNPMAEKSHEFTLVTTSQPDGDNDGIENMLDTCPLTPNIQSLDERGQWQDPVTDPDGDGLDGACDPDPLNRSQISPSLYMPDEDLDNYANRADNCATVPNGIEVPSGQWFYSGKFSFFAFNYGALIGPSNQLDTDGDDIGDACEGAETGPQCANDLDDDGDGAVNDGCPIDPIRFGETGAQCDNDVDDDGNGKVNDGCPRVGSRAEAASAQTIREYLSPDSVIASSQYSSSYPPSNAFDGKTNTSWCTSGSDRAPGNYIEAQFASPQDIETVDFTNQFAGERFNTGRITMSNGFSLDVTLSSRGEGSFDIPDQTGVTWVRFTGLTQNTSDACFSEFALNLNFVTVPAECDNATDDDGDGVVNDGCPGVQTPSNGPEIACDNDVDDDTDGLVNDGCPAVDPGNVARDTITGHVHVVTLTQGVPIFKHGIKLNQLGGPKNVNSGARTYSVDVSNLADSAEDVQVGLRVVEGCAAVSGPSSVSVPADGSATASFTVDWTGCAAGTYTVQADACHAGDAAPAGLFGSGACPGVSDGMTDPNPLDDAPIAKSVEVGSP